VGQEVHGIVNETRQGLPGSAPRPDGLSSATVSVRRVPRGGGAKTHDSLQNMRAGLAAGTPQLPEPLKFRMERPVALFNVSRGMGIPPVSKDVSRV